MSKKGSQIFELFGYPVDTWNQVAQANLSRCNCPFMDAECDGGGNRFLSGIRLPQNHPLKRFFLRKSLVQAGVCSLQLKPGEQPWVVCPRRLLNYRTGSVSELQNRIKQELCDKSELVKGRRYNVWSEVKMKCPVVTTDGDSLFDYTFDYVIAGRARLPIAEIAEMVELSEDEARKCLQKAGYTLCRKSGTTYCDDFPTYPLVIVEVMTSSTCGGNKKKRTQISQVFEDTILKLNGVNVEPAGPAINYRQVWARMVSQLLVKSQIGMAWGGTTFWVLQDLLAHYISKTTALNLDEFLSAHKDEVNVISGGYGRNLVPENRTQPFALIDDVKLYAGPVQASESKGKSFSDIIKLGGAPHVNELWKKLAAKTPCGSFDLA